MSSGGVRSGATDYVDFPGNSVEIWAVPKNAVSAGCVAVIRTKGAACAAIAGILSEREKTCGVDAAVLDSIPFLRTWHRLCAYVNCRTIFITSPAKRLHRYQDLIGAAFVHVRNVRTLNLSTDTCATGRCHWLFLELERIRFLRIRIASPPVLAGDFKGGISMTPVAP